MAFRVVPLGSGRFTGTTPRPCVEKGRAGRTITATCSVQPGILPLWPLLGGRLEALVHGLRLFGRDRDFLILLAQFFMHESEGVVARRQSLVLVLPILGRYGEEWALHHVDVHLHPRMLVALDRQHDLFAREILLDCGRRRRLRLVPLAVVFRRGMDVVGGWIVIVDLYGLAGHHAEHVRMILASLLVEYDWIFGHIERAAA